MSIAVVPVKRLAATKSRLFSDADTAARQTLALAMLRDVLDALRAAKRVDRILVATPDADVAEAARSAGAEALVRDDPGLNPALEAAARASAPDGDEPLLVVLGDVAGACAEDLDALFDALDALGGRGVVLAPSNDGGTSALLRAPHDAIPACFGPDSARRHREAAAAADVRYRELALPSLDLDLDLPEDVERFLQGGRAGRATREALRRIGFGAGA